jgi:hypothetical protein
MRGLAILGSTILMTNATACTAHEPIAQNNVGFLCAVDGTKMLKPDMSSDEVCSLFKAKIDDALKQKTMVVQDESGALPANWFKLEIRFSMPARASALVVQSADGQEITHPEIAVDVVDKYMAPSDVGTLASAVAQYLAEKTKR